MLSLPPDLESAIAQSLRSLPRSQWQAAARRLSRHYRDRETTIRHGTPPSSIQNPRSKIQNEEALGYAAFVLPAAYAQLWGALRATALRIPSFHPTTLLDLGSGPGTALWAAVEHFPSLTTLHAYEREPAFISLGKTLAQSSPHPALRQAHWRQLTFTHTHTLPLPPPNKQYAVSNTQYDLIIIAHALNEMDPSIREALLLSAWEQCSGLLLIVEPGTTAAFPIILQARDLLLSHSAHVIAPCAHNLPCPLPSADPNDWCHFPQRLQRPQFQRIAKEATAGWEESKFSYSALARFPAESPIWGRLLHQPQQTKIGVDLTVSAVDTTIHHPHISKRDRPRYKAASDLHWGDPLDAPIES